MLSIDDISRVHHIQKIELEGWIAQRWVRPQATVHGYAFDEIDEARIALICELRQEFLVNDEALGVVLSLLDQLYAAHRLLHDVEQAMGNLPEPVRRQIRMSLGKLGSPIGS